MSTYVVVVISPATTTRPGRDQRLARDPARAGRPSRTASRTASEIWSAILSGCPSVTDSELKLNERVLISERRIAVARTVSRRTAPAHSEVGSRCISVATRSAERDAVEHGADAFRDRHLDVEPAGEVAQHGCGRQALDDHADLGRRLGGRRALRDELAAAAVAARLRPAGDDEVAHAREAGERLGPRARPPRRSGPSPRARGRRARPSRCRPARGRRRRRRRARSRSSRPRTARRRRRRR